MIMALQQKILKKPITDEGGHELFNSVNTAHRTKQGTIIFPQVYCL